MLESTVSVASRGGTGCLLIKAALAAAMAAYLLPDAAIAQSQAQNEALWALRRRRPEANQLTGAVCNSDTSVPINKVKAFIALTERHIGQIHSGLRINR